MGLPHTFPQPSQEALDAGVLSDEDAEENVRAIHEELIREALFVLHSLDAVLDARRLGVDGRVNATSRLVPARMPAWPIPEPTHYHPSPTT
jgi:hypothetical protein